MSQLLFSLLLSCLFAIPLWAATVGHDTFTEPTTDTELSAHTADTGAGWSVSIASMFFARTATGDVEHERAALDYARKEDNLGTDLMTVTGVCKSGVGTSRVCGVVARMSGTNFTNGFEALLQGNGTSVDLKLFKNVGGTRTQLGSTIVGTAGSGVIQTIRLEIGNGTQQVFIEEDSPTTPHISTTEANTTLQGNHFAGILMNGDSVSTTRITEFLSATAAAGAARRAVIIE